jgi:hypothetical protein
MEGHWRSLWYVQYGRFGAAESAETAHTSAIKPDINIFNILNALHAWKNGFGGGLLYLMVLYKCFKLFLVMHDFPKKFIYQEPLDGILRFIR